MITGPENCSSPLTRKTIVKEAREWIGTPYHHQASSRGVGTDCLGMVRGIWRNLYGYEAEEPPAYSGDWAEATGQETLIAAANRHLVRIEPQAARPGDVLLFRFRRHLPAKHVAILVDEQRIVHAAESGPVVEVALAPWWRRRIAAVFQFPGLAD